MFLTPLAAVAAAAATKRAREADPAQSGKFRPTFSPTQRGKWARYDPSCYPSSAGDLTWAHARARERCTRYTSTTESSEIVREEPTVFRGGIDRLRGSSIIIVATCSYLRPTEQKSLFCAHARAGARSLSRSKAVAAAVAAATQNSARLRTRRTCFYFVSFSFASA